MPRVTWAREHLVGGGRPGSVRAVPSAAARLLSAALAATLVPRALATPRAQPDPHAPAAPCAPAAPRQPCPEAARVGPTPPELPDDIAGWPSEPHVVITGTWLMLQLLPSPGVIHARGRAALTLKWQLTPWLWSFGIDPRLSPLRTFVAEPAVRYSGSVELVVEPQYWAVFPAAGDRFGARVALRSYFPVLHRGEYLSLSLSSGGLWFPRQGAASIELGAHILFGVLGLTAGVDAGPGFRALRYGLKVRVF